MNVQVFRYEQNELITVEYNSGLWFLAKDVANILGYRNDCTAIKRHVEQNDQRTLQYRACPETGQPKIWHGSDYAPKRLINRSGMYALMEGSKLPRARRFQHWLNHSVLPSISDTGVYIDRSAKEDKLMQMMATYYSSMSKDRAMIIAIKSMRNVVKTDQELKQVREQERIDHPDAVSYRSYVHNPSLMTTTVIAKDYGLTAVALNRILHKHHIIFYQGGKNGHWVLYSRYDGKGSAGYDAFNVNDYYQTHTLKWTAKGRQFIFSLLNKYGYQPSRPVKPFPKSLVSRVQQYMEQSDDKAGSRYLN